MVRETREKLNQILNGLPAQEKRLYVCHSARRLLGDFERAFPCDVRPRRAIETSERYAFGKATKEELDAAKSGAKDAIKDAEAAWVAEHDAVVAGGVAEKTTPAETLSAARDAEANAQTVIKASSAAWTAAQSDKWINVTVMSRATVHAADREAKKKDDREAVEDYIWFYLHERVRGEREVENDGPRP